MKMNAMQVSVERRQDVVVIAQDDHGEDLEVHITPEQAPAVASWIIEAAGARKEATASVSQIPLRNLLKQIDKINSEVRFKTQEQDGPPDLSGIAVPVPEEWWQVVCALADVVSEEVGLKLSGEPDKRAKTAFAV